MGYDCSILDPHTNKTIHTKQAHHLHGGTYAVGGTTELWISVTYNYSKFFHIAFGNGIGLVTLQGLTVEASQPILWSAIRKLEGEADADYWASTEGNARHALIGLLMLALQAPIDGIWEIG